MTRERLSRERVRATAEQVADEVGFARLTLAAVAERLGVRLPSLYKHVDGLDALRRDLTVHAKRELAEVMAAAAVGRSGEDALRSLAYAYRSWAGAHPGRYAATVRAGEPGDTDEQEAGRAAAAVVLAVLRGWGLTGEPAVHATRALRSALHGFVALEADGGFGMPVDVDTSFEVMVNALGGALRDVRPAAAGGAA